MLRKCLAITILLSLAVNASPSQKKDLSYDLWLIRSQSLTQDLIKDAADLQASKRAVLLAELAKRWWPYDQKKAKTWTLQSIAVVEDIPNKETAEERQRRLKTTRELVKIVAPLDKELGARLVGLLSEDSKQTGEGERLSNADGLFDAAVALVNVDPPRAYQLGLAALRMGPSTKVTELIFAFRRINSKLADTLLKEALLVAKQTLDPEFLHQLTGVTYPALKWGLNVPDAPDELRTELLMVDLAYIQANPITVETRNSVCAGIIGFIVPVMREFELRLPQQAPAVRQAISRCQSISPLSQQLMDDGLRSQPLKTVDDLLKAAADAQDSQVKAVYEYRAAALAKEEKQYDRALSILDRISKEGREFMGVSLWQYYRWDWSALSALDHYARGDFNEMRLVLARVPDDLQAYAKLTFVDQLPAKRNADADPTLELLSDARKGLSTSTSSDSERYGWYFGLLRLTVKYQPADAPAVLKEAFSILNRSEQSKEKGRQTDEAVADSSGVWSNLTVTLIEMDEFAVKEAVASIGSAQTRIQVRLELLHTCLNRMKRSLENTKRPASSG